MQVNDFSATAPSGLIKNHSPSRRRGASQYVRTSGNSIAANKSMDIFIPNVTKTPDRQTRRSNKNNRNDNEIDFFTSPVQSPTSPRQNPSPRGNIHQSLTESNLTLSQKSKSTTQFNLKNSHTQNSTLSPNFKDLHNFNKDFCDQLTISKLEQIFENDQISLANFNILLDQDLNCRLHPSPFLEERDPSESLLLTHNFPQVSIDEKAQTKFLVHTINEAITKTRDMETFDELSLPPAGDDLLPESISVQQLETEVDIWLSAINECIKATKSKSKPISLVYLVAQRSLRDIIKRLITGLRSQNYVVREPQKVVVKEPVKKEVMQPVSLEDQMKKLDNRTDDDLAPIVGALKRDIDKLELRNRSLLAEQFDLKAELSRKELQAQQLLDVNLRLRQTISETEHRLAASTLQAGTTNGKTNLGVVPTEAQMVWGELTEFVKDMTVGLKRINLDKLLPTSLDEFAQAMQTVPEIKNMSPQRSQADGLELQPRQTQRRRTLSFVNHNMISYNLDLHDLATNQTLPISKTDDTKDNQNKSSEQATKSFRIVTQPDLKLHFSYFLNNIGKFTDTCPGSLKSQPASAIYSNLENDLKHLLSMISAKYRERLLSIQNETQKMKENHKNEINNLKNESSDRSLWVRCMLQNDELLTIPKDLKISEDYKLSIPIILTKMLEIINPAESEAFQKQFSIQLNKRNTSIRPKMVSEALLDSFPKAHIEQLIEMIAFINKTYKSDVVIEYLQKFLINELPYQHFAFFCRIYITSPHLMKLDSRSKPQMVSRLFNIYGYSSSIQAKDRQNYEYTYLSNPSLFIIFVMSLYEHVIEKLKNHVISKFDEKVLVEPALKNLPQKFYSDFLYTLTDGQPQDVTDDLLEYLTSISSDKLEIDPLEVAIAMFNYAYPLDNVLADFNMDQEESHAYINIYQENEKNKNQKGKKSKTQKLRTIETIKPEDF